MLDHQPSLTRKSAPSLLALLECLRSFNLPAPQKHLLTFTTNNTPHLLCPKNLNSNSKRELSYPLPSITMPTAEEASKDSMPSARLKNSILLS